MGTLFDRLEALRKETGLSGRAFAESCELAPSHYSAIKRGTRPSISTLARIAEKMKVELAWLAHGVGEKQLREERSEPLETVRRMGVQQGFDPAWASVWEDDSGAVKPDADYLWTMMKAAWVRRQRAIPPREDLLKGVEQVPKSDRKPHAKGGRPR